MGVAQIFKYKLNGNTDFKTGKNAKLLTVQLQQGMTGPQPVVWAQVDPNDVIVKRHIVYYGTGEAFDDAEKHIYIATTQDSQGFVWHWFEKLS